MPQRIPVLRICSSQAIPLFLIVSLFGYSIIHFHFDYSNNLYARLFIQGYLPSLVEIVKIHSHTIRKENRESLRDSRVSSEANNQPLIRHDGSECKPIGMWARVRMRVCYVSINCCILWILQKDHERESNALNCRYVDWRYIPRFPNHWHWKSLLNAKRIPGFIDKHKGDDKLALYVIHRELKKKAIEQSGYASIEVSGRFEILTYFTVLLCRSPANNDCILSRLVCVCASSLVRALSFTVLIRFGWH